MDLIIKTTTRFFKIDGEHFLRGGLWLLSSQAVVVVLSLITTVILSRLLTQQEFGVYRYVISLGLIFGLFSLTGITQAIAQATAKGFVGFFVRGIRATLAYGTIITLLSVITGLYYALMGNETLAWGCFLIATLQPISQIFGCTVAFLQGKQDFKYVTITQTLKSIFVSATTIITILFTKNIVILLAAYFLSQSISAVVTYFIFRPKSDTKISKVEHVYKKFLSFARHSSLRNIIDGFSSRIDSIVIFQYLGAVELAIYTISSILPEQIRGSLKHFQVLALPKFNKYESVESNRSIIYKKASLFFLFLVVLSVFAISLIPYVYGLFFPDYSDSVFLAQILLTSIPASVFIIPIGFLQIQHQEKALYKYHITTSAIQIVSLLGLTFIFGLYGTVISKVLSQYMKAIISFLLFSKIRDNIISNS